MTAALFLMLVAAMSALAIGVAWRSLSRTAAWVVTLGLPAWLAYAGALGWLGILRDPAMRPPGMLWLFAPLVLFMVFFAVRSAAARRIALAIPLALLVGAQVFRVAVELLIHRLWGEGLVPRLMTYAGGNIDIAIGLTAPLMAWLLLRNRLRPWMLQAWNTLGLLTLANVAVRAVLTAPGPLNWIHAEIANVAAGVFPYVYLPGFLAPLAVLLHVLALRAARAPVARSTTDATGAIA